MVAPHQVLRVLPYSACQLCSYDMYKRLLGGPDGERLTVLRRLAAGAAAGMTSTLVRPYKHPCTTFSYQSHAAAAGRYCSVQRAMARFLLVCNSTADIVQHMLPDVALQPWRRVSLTPAIHSRRFPPELAS